MIILMKLNSKSSLNFVIPIITNILMVVKCTLVLFKPKTNGDKLTVQTVL
jgi:hypothetical protein